MRELINLKVNEAKRKEVAKLAKEKGIIVPTFAQMKDPSLIPAEIKEKLKNVGLWDIDPLNLFRISWKNEPKEKGGLYQDLPNFIEVPSAISGVKAKIIAMSGKYFPTGAHKVGPSFACLVPRLVTGQFDPKEQAAVWPSTGNYCRGGAFNSKLLGCKAIAILPENMSAERFNWLKSVAGEVIATPGSESNVKEIYDETWRLVNTRGDKVVIMNQFAELGNHLWHYTVTGNAMNDIVKAYMAKDADIKLRGVCLTSGSAGTLAAGDFLKDNYKDVKLAVGEAVQCPTLIYNGFGEHWIEGIGDKHVPWVHNVKNSDMIIAVDDRDALALFRLAAEPAGREYFKGLGVSEDVLDKLPLIGVSGAANICMCIKFAKYYELTEKDIVITVLTDSGVMYGSRLEEMAGLSGGSDYREAHYVEMDRSSGEYTVADAKVDHYYHVIGLETDHMLELSYIDKKRIHNLKYYTWVEQQGKEVAELNEQWYDYDNYWGRLHKMAPELDALIDEFNKLAAES